MSQARPLVETLLVGLMSLTITVPDAVPSLFHSAAPVAPGPSLSSSSASEPSK